MELKRVVVTGLGAITPIGKNVSEFWENLKNGVSGAGPITRFNPTNFKTRFACEVKDYNPDDYFHKKVSSRLDYFSQFALICADEAVNDAKIDLEKINHDRVGVIWGSGIGGIKSLVSEVKDFALGDGVPKFSPFFVPKIITDIACGHISMKYGFRGPNFTTIAACASSTVALIDALNYIRLGKMDMAIAGGSEASVEEASLAGFSSMKAISSRNDDPKTASRPFDKDRDGFVMGEGGAALVLEEYEHAVKRGAKIYCELVGGGLSADAHHLTAPHPEGLGASNVMKNALEDANMRPEEIDYINVHGTATPLGDRAELIACKKIFGEHIYNINISSTKSMTGHLLGGAGAIEALATILAIVNQVAPPTINQFELDPEIDAKLNLTPNKSQERKITAGLSNTFGFGGHNASVIFKKLD